MWVVQQRSRRRGGILSIDRVALLDKIGMVWEPSAVRWEKNYEAAADFSAEHGHLRPSVDAPLYKWLAVQRQQQAAGRLSESQTELLSQLGMAWAESLGQREANGLAHAEEYRAEHGHLSVPRSYASADGFPLGSWLSVRRQERRAGRLPLSRQQALDELGMDWGGQSPASRMADNARTFRALEEAASFKAAHGHLRVPRDYEANGIRLGIWLNTQRKKRSKGVLRPDVSARLDALGIVWMDQLEDRWGLALGLAAAYAAQNGDLRVPKERVVDGFPLGEWINKRRREQREGRLDPKRKRLLDELGMVWDPFGGQWEQGVRAARAFRGENGHLRVPQSYVTDGFRLGAWISNRRQDQRLGRLAADRKQILDELGMAWSKRTSSAGGESLVTPSAEERADAAAIDQALSDRKAGAKPIPLEDLAEELGL